jgi:hypothetical protein
VKGGKDKIHFTSAEASHSARRCCTMIVMLLLPVAAWSRRWALPPIALTDLCLVTFNCTPLAKFEAISPTVKREAAINSATLQPCFETAHCRRVYKLAMATGSIAEAGPRTTTICLKSTFLQAHALSSPLRLSLSHSLLCPLPLRNNTKQHQQKHHPQPITPLCQP